MKYLLLLSLFLAPAFLSAQSAAPAQADKPAESPSKPASEKPDPKLHADVLKFVELTGAKKGLENALPSMIEEGKKEIVKRCPQCSPEFAEEWTKRMRERVKADLFVDVLIKTYEKYFSDEEILELIQLQEKAGQQPPPTPSPKLLEKLKSTMPTFMGEVTGGCTEIGAKIGGEIGEEIEKEHPEYSKPKPTEKQ